MLRGGETRFAPPLVAPLVCVSNSKVISSVLIITPLYFSLYFLCIWSFNVLRIHSISLTQTEGRQNEDEMVKTLLKQYNVPEMYRK